MSRELKQTIVQVKPSSFLLNYWSIFKYQFEFLNFSVCDASNSYAQNFPMLYILTYTRRVFPLINVVNDADGIKLYLYCLPTFYINKTSS